MCIENVMFLSMLSRIWSWKRSSYNDSIVFTLMFRDLNSDLLCLSVKQHWFALRPIQLSSREYLLQAKRLIYL